ncbi:hypothetical protein EYF80_047550 [Liparis tanakae]|uniref:Uncharacterized protein n=1 Tax=Liparis tanakae TaxID=230148 RepID=A0A4Z2FMC8_9TELE|nr:hypothetical protein EYF80_047550 [Liparis tanakae]
MPLFIAVWVPLIFGTFMKPGLQPIRSPPGNVSLGMDWRRRGGEDGKHSGAAIHSNGSAAVCFTAMTTSGLYEEHNPSATSGSPSFRWYRKDPPYVCRFRGQPTECSARPGRHFFSSMADGVGLGFTVLPQVELLVELLGQVAVAALSEHGDLGVELHPSLKDILQQERDASRES